MKTLLVIDVQRDFCPGGTLAVSRGDEIVPVINRIAGLFPLIAATQDWHPAGHVSFASAHGKNPGEVIELPEAAGGGQQVLWADHCVQGTGGGEFHPDLDTRRFSLILRKGANPGIDSYSAFLENDKKTSTGLAGWLKEKKAGALYFCGLATDYCVYYSVMDALARGFEAWLILDAVRGVDFPANNVEKALAAMEQAGVKFVNSGELLNV